MGDMGDMGGNISASKFTNSASLRGSSRKNSDAQMLGFQPQTFEFGSGLTLCFGFTMDTDGFESPLQKWLSGLRHPQSFVSLRALPAPVGSMSFQMNDLDSHPPEIPRFNGCPSGANVTHSLASLISGYGPHQLADTNIEGFVSRPATPGLRRISAGISHPVMQAE